MTAWDGDFASQMWALPARTEALCFAESNCGGALRRRIEAASRVDFAHAAIVRDAEGSVRLRRVA